MSLIGVLFIFQYTVMAQELFKLIAMLGHRGFWVRCETPEVRASSGFRSRAQALHLRLALNPKNRNPAFGSRFSVRGLRSTTFDGL